MEPYKVILILHVVSGFSALFGGLVPIFAKKGSKLHTKGGWIYFWAMFGVLLTTIALFSIKPDRLLFLLLVGIFSFYNAFSGVRSIRFKKPVNKATLLDWGIAGLVSLCGFSMISLSIYYFSTPTGVQAQAVLFLVFGSICLFQAVEDLLRFKKIASGLLPKKERLIMHIGRMGGAYIATCTAFFVVNIHFLPPLVVWLTPTIIGTVLISRATRSYKKGNLKKVPLPQIT